MLFQHFGQFEITRSSRACCRGRACAQEALAASFRSSGDFHNQEIAMKSKELNQALRLLSEMLADPRLGPHQTVQLQCARRELLKVAQSGNLDRHRVFRAVEKVACVLNDMLSDRNP
jgi:hypothetical protein